MGEVDFGFPHIFFARRQMITVKIYATLREGRQKIYELSSAEFSSAGDIMSYLNIPAGEVAILLINGFHSKAGDAVRDGDTISLFPPCAGG
jgi:molybdopterin synthase sulfur carrier subunit